MEHLITANEILEIAFIGEEKVGEDKIKNVHIDIAEKEFIKPSLGLLYDAIIEGLYPELALKLKEPVAFYVRYLVLPDIMVSVSNMGVFQSINEYSKPVSSAVQNTLLQRTLKNAETLKESVIQYIQDNYLNYPEYSYKKSSRIIGGIIL